MIKCLHCNGMQEHCMYVDCPLKNQTEDDIAVLNTPTYRDEFPGLSLEDVCWSQHNIILQQKKEIAALREALYGHNDKCLNQNY